LIFDFSQKYTINRGGLGSNNDELLSVNVRVSVNKSAVEYDNGGF
jgi:hypothetical protein